MSYRAPRFSSLSLRQEPRNRQYLWRLLWLLPFLWAGTLGEVLHHYVELPAQYHCAAEEVHGVTDGAEHVNGAEYASSSGSGAKVRAHLCHGHHTHDAGHCLTCRHLSRIASPSFALALTLVTKPLLLQSADHRVLSPCRQGQPVRGPPLLLEQLAISV